jgi:hypothetical protein
VLLPDIKITVAYKKPVHANNEGAYYNASITNWCIKANNPFANGN